MRPDIPQEVLHYTERTTYKRWLKQKRLALLENIVFTLLIIVLIWLSFTFGRLWEQTQVDKPKSIKSEFKVTNDLKWKV